MLVESFKKVNELAKRIWAELEQNYQVQQWTLSCLSLFTGPGKSTHAVKTAQ